MLDCEYSASHALSACQNPYSWKWHAIIAHNTGLRCMIKIWIKFTVTEELVRMSVTYSDCLGDRYTILGA